MSLYIAVVAREGDRALPLAGLSMAAPRDSLRARSQARSFQAPIIGHRRERDNRKLRLRPIPATGT
jgi:hypothetical protein